MPRKNPLKAHLQNWLLLCSVTAIGTILYLSTSLNAHPQELLMPLDDSYIHFQYTRALAQGKPFDYNLSGETSSGDTSLLYPFLLAIGHLLGFTQLSLGIWAVLIGSLAHLASAWLIYKLLVEPKQPTFIPLTVALSFAVSGAFFWAALSGMETSLFISSILFTLYAYQQLPSRYTLSAAAFAALVRPEGAVIALSAAAAMYWQDHKRSFGWLGLPILSVMLQPILNFALTGSFAASGSAAKSHLYNVSIPFADRLAAVLDFKERLWRELAIGYSPDDGLYMVFLVSLPAFAAILFSIRTSWRSRTISTGLLAAIWMVLLSAAVAALDTAFWHFKRYQLPIMALMFPLAGWLMMRLAALLFHGDRWLFNLISLFIFLGSGGTFFSFALRYHDNVQVIAQQQLLMANWVRENLPPDALIAVHDVGVLRYIGNRQTYDVVGLTSGGSAAAWRQGAGTLYEDIARQQPRPQYFAIYPDVLSIPYLVEAGVLGEELAQFELRLPKHTVASATGIQVITRANWEGVEAAADLRQSSTRPYLAGFELIDTLNVADLEDEADHAYEWWNAETPAGFVSDVRRLPYVACEAEPCTIIDGGRVITGGERFRLPRVASDQAVMVVLRAQAASSAVLTAGCAGEDQQTRVVPSIPAHWVEIFFLLTQPTEEFCLETQGAYYPARYWVYAGSYNPPAPTGEVLAAFSDPLVTDFTIRLLNFEVEITDHTLILTLRLASDGNFGRDGKFFVHLYGDVNAPPLAQADIYAGGGALPPANWLEDVREERITLPLEGLPSGKYTLALGLYDPLTNQRYPSASAALATDGERLFLEQIALP